MLFLPVIVILVMIDFVPALVAFQRHHRNRMAIAVLDLLVGWTFIGWVVALVWACTKDVEPASTVKSA